MSSSSNNNIQPFCTSNISNFSSATTKRRNFLQSPVKREDDSTECETPVSSPETDSTTGTRNMTQAAKVKTESPMENKSNVEADAELSENEEGHDYSEWPMTNISEPGKNDVLFGRGGG